MNTALTLDYDEDHQAIGAAIDRFCEQWGVAAAARRELWRALAELGVFGAGAPNREDAGDAQTLCAIAEALGRNVFPGPVADTFLALQVLEGETAEEVIAGRTLVAVSRGDTGLFPWGLEANLFFIVNETAVARTGTPTDLEPLQTLGGEIWGRGAATGGDALAGSGRALTIGNIAAAAYMASYAFVKSTGMLESIAGIPAGDVICLHACCHNPTGADPSPDEWKQIADAVDAKGLLPLLDFAYLGFGDGIEADRTALLEFARPGAELLVAASYSKNFGLYRERTGALTVVTPTLEMSGTVASRVKTAIRTNYSNPPAHGATVVREILRDDELRKQWDSELAGMRDRINAMRTLFTRSMAERLPDRDFSFIGQQRGMFSYSGLTGEQVDQLRERYSIYVVRDGRINVAGLNTENVPTVCDAIASVLSEASG